MERERGQGQQGESLKRSRCATMGHIVMGGTKGVEGLPLWRRTAERAENRMQVVASYELEVRNIRFGIVEKTIVQFKEGVV